MPANSPLAGRTGGHAGSGGFRRVPEGPYSPPVGWRSGWPHSPEVNVAGFPCWAYRIQPGNPPSGGHHTLRSRLRVGDGRLRAARDPPAGAGSGLLIKREGGAVARALMTAGVYPTRCWEGAVRSEPVSEFPARHSITGKKINQRAPRKFPTPLEQGIFCPVTGK